MQPEKLPVRLSAAPATAQSSSLNQQHRASWRESYKAIHSRPLATSSEKQALQICRKVSGSLGSCRQSPNVVVAKQCRDAWRRLLIPGTRRTRKLAGAEVSRSGVQARPKNEKAACSFIYGARINAGVPSSTPQPPGLKLHQLARKASTGRDQGISKFTGSVDRVMGKPPFCREKYFARSCSPRN